MEEDFGTPTGRHTVTRKLSVSLCFFKDGIDLFGLNNSQVVNQGIDTKKYDPTQTFKDTKRELGLPKNKIIVGFLVRMTAQRPHYSY
jgi:hypothetical protein